MIDPNGSHLIDNSAPLAGSTITLSLEQSYPYPPSIILISSISKTIGYSPVTEEGNTPGFIPAGGKGGVVIILDSVTISVAPPGGVNSSPG